MDVSGLFVLTLATAVSCFAGMRHHAAAPPRVLVTTSEVIEPEAPMGDISFQALIQHYVATGALVEARPEESLSYSQPLAKGASSPQLMSLQELVSRLPTFVVEDASSSG